MCDTKLSLLLCRVAVQRRHPPSCRRYPTGTGVAGNRGVGSSRHNVASSVRMAGQGVSSARDSQHQRGREPGSCGLVNSGEALLNVVMTNKRKMLSRLGQKARGQVRLLSCQPAQVQYHRRKGATFPTLRQRRNVVSPSSSSSGDRRGKRPVRSAERTAGKGGGNKRRLACNGPDRGCASRPDHPTAKAGRLPSGVGVRERWSNRLEEAMQKCRRSVTLLLVRLPTVPCVGSHSVTYRLSSRPMRITACCPRCVDQCLSCMRGNTPVQF
jgi:hypothetical protein